MVVHDHHHHQLLPGPYRDHTKAFSAYPVIVAQQPLAADDFSSSSHLHLPLPPPLRLRFPLVGDFARVDSPESACRSAWQPHLSLSREGNRDIHVISDLIDHKVIHRGYGRDMEITIQAVVAYCSGLHGSEKRPRCTLEMAVISENVQPLYHDSIALTCKSSPVLEIILPVDRNVPIFGPVLLATRSKCFLMYFNVSLRSNGNIFFRLML